MSGPRLPRATLPADRRRRWVVSVRRNQPSLWFGERLRLMQGDLGERAREGGLLVLLPYVAAFNLPAAPAAKQALRRVPATDNVPKHLARTSADLGAPRSLAELGLSERDFDEITAQAQPQSYANPRPVTEEALRSLLADALHGTLAP